MINNVDFGKRRQQAHLKFVGRARNFFKQIGLPFEIIPNYEPDPTNTFFKGCWWHKSKLHFCPARVNVGELLHEAGHGALLPKSLWHTLAPGEIPLCPPLGLFSQIGDFAVEAWDYAAAKNADIPSLEVFANGFDGAGWQVWEAFDSRQHPGFILLRFLKMSSGWGKCDRWFVGNYSVEPTNEAMRQLIDSCSILERKLLHDTCTYLLKNQVTKIAGEIDSCLNHEETTILF